MSNQDKQPLEYINAVYAHVVHWYENADRKAQIVLVFDGAFLSFITSQAFTKAEDLKEITKCFGPETTLLLALMALSLAASILSAITCLHPRLHAERGKTEWMLKTEIDKSDTAEPIPARLLWFFGYLAQLDQERVASQLQNVNDPFAAKALAHEVAKFSRNVFQKHRWADRAFLCASSSLIFLLLATASYWLRTAWSSCT
ncbi:MAG: hypothetical protein JW896_13280 [Deltaproteobacteria bacterium]|nr:hypothetical protein [Deltaproteobacteria bacterium]